MNALSAKLGHATVVAKVSSSSNQQTDVRTDTAGHLRVQFFDVVPDDVVAIDDQRCCSSSCLAAMPTRRSRADLGAAGPVYAGANPRRKRLIY